MAVFLYKKGEGICCLTNGRAVFHIAEKHQAEPAPAEQTAGLCVTKKMGLQETGCS